MILKITNQTIDFLTETTLVTITFPDGNSKAFDKALTGEELARSISPSLYKRSAAMIVDGIERDLMALIEKDSKVEIITTDTEKGLEIIRHDAAHVFAQAIKELYPKAQITIGPAIDDGFYYDVFYDQTIGLDDFAKIEQRMLEIVKRDEKIVREIWNRADAIKLFEDMGEKFKAEIIRDLPEDAEISLYRQGSFIDLCRGPHMPSTGKLGTAFKLMRVSGAYWRGDPKNPVLQRIYGTAWANKEQLDAYLLRLEEAEKRDHRKLGREMDLFHMQEEAVGSIFWHPKGWTIYRLLENFVRQKLERAGYVEVKTPQLVDSSLWKASGHWDKFGDNMFTVESEDKTLAIKPMNCPCHVQIFKQGLKSYRDLPMRMAEFGSCHRNESSGSMHGIMRVRAFTQDDAHIFCEEHQIENETKMFCDLLKDIYKTFGFEDIVVKFSDRPENRAGSDDVWDRAEEALKRATDAAGIKTSLNPGEGAFYGPKLEFVLKDAVGRDWQCGTLQVDYVLPERLDATYVGEDGQKHRPVMLHRAVLGAFERFVGILIEHYAGKFPLWLAPTQFVVATITGEADDYAKTICESLKDHGLRAELDIRNEKIGYKVREHSLKKVPIILVVGKQEKENNSVAIRRLGSQDADVKPFEDALSAFLIEAKVPHS